MEVELLLLDGLRVKYENTTYKKDLLKRIIVEQPYSQRYCFYIQTSGKDCTYAKILYKHYSQYPMGSTSYFEYIPPEYGKLTCKGLILELLKSREEEDFKELYKILCQK